MEDAVETIYELTADKAIREQCKAREKYIREVNTVLKGREIAFQQRDAAYQELDKVSKELEQERQERERERQQLEQLLQENKRLKEQLSS